MPQKPLKTVEARTAAQWRAWLAGHHDSESEVWLVFNKRHTGRASVAYEDAVDEALCVGWIDSLVKRLDDARYARKFTPRRPGSVWSTVNRRRYARLEAEGRLLLPGRRRAPTDRRAAAARPLPRRTPRYILQAIGSQPAARDFFRTLAPSYRRMCVGWIDSAKRPDTRRRRLAEVVRLLAAGRRLGLK